MRNHRRNSMLPVTALLAALVLVTAPAMGQAVWESYAAKFVCGPYDRGLPDFAAALGRHQSIDPRTQA